MSDKPKVQIDADNKRATVRLDGVRLSFPSLFKPSAFAGGDNAKYSASFLMPKDSENAENMKKAVKALIDAAFKGKSPGADRVCLRNGADKDYDGYGPEVMYVSASNAKKVPIVDRDRTPLGEEDGRPYAGCYVNVLLQLWAQDNQYGKRINASLQAVQFAADGEPFGAGGVDPEEAFEDVSDESGDGDDEAWL